MAEKDKIWVAYDHGNILYRFKELTKERIDLIALRALVLRGRKSEQNNIFSGISPSKGDYAKRKARNNFYTFLEKNNFAGKKVGIFISSLMPREEVMKRYIDAILTKNTTLKPFNVEVFGGRIRIFGKTSQDMVDIERAKEWTRTISENFLC